MTSKIDNKAKNNRLRQIVVENAQRQKGEIKLTEKKIQEMEDYFESVTGYKIDYNDIDWNKFVYGYSVTQSKTKKVSLYSLVFLGILGVISLVYPSFTVRSIIYPYFFESVALYLVAMECFIPFIAGHFPLYDSIGILAMVHKIVEKTSRGQKFWFFGRWLLIIILLAIDKVCFELIVNA